MPDFNHLERGINVKVIARGKRSGISTHPTCSTNRTNRRKIMRKLTALLAAALFLGASGQAMAITADASASVINPISVVQTRALDFGRIITTVPGGVVVLSAETAPFTAGSTAGLINGTSYASGQFTVTGDSNTGYAITCDTTASLTGPGTAMPLALTTDKTSGTTATTTLYALATDEFYVGGTLTVPANQIPGSYSGTYSVTVAYN